MSKVTDTPLPLRYVAFSDNAGVYLNDGVWSMGQNTRDQAQDYDAARTFASQEEFKEHLESTKQSKLLYGYRMCEVWPDLPDNFASKKKIADAGLPVW